MYGSDLLFFASQHVVELCLVAAANERLKLLLSFAVGGLLGDVFLHLLPEAWAHVDKCMYILWYKWCGDMLTMW